MEDPLSRLVKKADAVANSASVLVQRTIREVRGEIQDLSGRMNLAGSADARDAVFAGIRKRFARLSKRLDALMSAQNELAAQRAAKSAGEMTGLPVKYSAARANAILELVTPAQGENLAAVFTDRMSKRMIDTLRESTVAALREQAVAGGTVKELSRDMAARWAEALKVDDPKFVDSAGHVWDTRQYFQMNTRTNTMRVYNDCLVDNVARETGTDLMRISTGGDPDCPYCSPWEGVIVSISGKTKGLPTYEQARQAGCFHPNCVHTLEYVDEAADADEIALQLKHPVTGDPTDADAQDERKYEIDQARKMGENPGMTKEQARVAVDRDNLAASIRQGLIRADAEDIVAKMTDAQVTALCPDGNPPRFEPVKRVRGGTRANPKYEPERWNRGRRGGVVHIKRDADLGKLLEVTGADNAKNHHSTGGNRSSSALKQQPLTIPNTDYTQKPIGESLRLITSDNGWDLEKVKLSQHDEKQLDIAIRRKKIVEIRKNNVLDAIKEAKKIKRKFGSYSQEFRDACAKENRLLNKYYKSKQIADNANRKTFAAQRNAFLSFFNSGECTITTSSINPRLKTVWSDACSWIKKTVAPSVFPTERIAVRTTRGRAYQDGNSINLSLKDSAKTYVHETMHFIEEFNPDVHRRCVEFLKHRTHGDKLESLNKLTGLKYRRDEMARPDKFFDPYCGKDYSNRRTGQIEATEILSMGAERLHEEPITFIREDPEYAKFCIALIQGKL